MGRTRSSRQCLRQAASDVRPAVIAAASVSEAPDTLDTPTAADAAGAGAPEGPRTTLHGHG
ncbi:hypothetical protein ACWFQ8_28145 [Streptomyces sp. NPDC055254]